MTTKGQATTNATDRRQQMQRIVGNRRRDSSGWTSNGEDEGKSNSKNKGNSKDEIQGSFAALRMTTSKVEDMQGDNFKFGGHAG
jgi:hypothetical protein